MVITLRQILIPLFVTLFAGQTVSVEKPQNPGGVKSEELPPCQACKKFVTSFLNAVNSEDSNPDVDPLSRLAKVQKKLCSDVQSGQSQCYALANEWEQLLKEWWLNQNQLGTLHQWLCIDKIEHCCPEDHYGPKCLPCQGFPDNICSKNGRCRGTGTRKGDGNCNCNTGYSGPTCDTCAENYYESYRDENKLLCSKCHHACKGSCTKAGQKGCFECNKGWLKDAQRGCLDLNECASKDSCLPNQFCVNNEGSYSCLSCDDSCDGCHGDGPDMCNNCNNGYTLKDGHCVPILSNPHDWTRYLTYLGLCIATCIIFQKNTIVASVIGLSVAVYVTVSEYMLSNLSLPNHNQFIQNQVHSLLKH